MEKWKLENDSCEHFTKEQQMEMEYDNPLCLDINPRLEVNGRRLRISRGCAVSYNPCLPDGVVCELEAKWVVDHYGLDAACGWVVYRYAFPWKRRPEINTLSLTLAQQRSQIPGPHFKTHAPGDSFRFVHPVSQTAYTLTVQELEQETLSLSSDRWHYPTHFTVMSYTLSPEASESITITDCDDGDHPLEIAPPADLFLPSATNDAACIGIIGGADGPTAILFGGGSGNLHTACSALHFEPVSHDMEWRITFHEKRFEDFSLILI